MKIAIQMFGHMRTYKQCYKSLFKNLLSGHDCDIFIHTWDKIDHNTKTWHDSHMESDITPEKLKSDIISIYHPRDILMETQHPSDMGYVVAGGARISKFGIYAMLYSMSAANNLRKKYEKQTHTKYDLVICLRPDLILFKPLVLQHYLDEYLKNAFYTAGNYKNKHRLNDWRYVGASDVLFFAQPRVMDNVFKNMKKIMAQAFESETSKYGPEYSFIYTIQGLGIDVFLINYLWADAFEILRPQKTGFFKRLFHR